LSKGARVSRDFLLFLAAGCFAGFSGSIVDSVFNNFLSDTFHLGDLQRTLLEVPRELPGLLVVFISGLFFFLSNRRLAVLANLMMTAGLVLIGFLSRTPAVMLVWLFLYSTGQHLFIPLSSGLGMELAQEGRHGRVLGNLQGAANLAAIAGSFLVFVGFARLGFTFAASFAIASGGFLAAALCILCMAPHAPVPAGTRFRLRKEYRLFYLLTVLYGTRKQIFLTFAPWVLVTVFRQEVQVLATLLTAGGVLGIGFKPLLGRMIDRLGERFILAGEAALLVFVCLGYGFARDLFPPPVALGVAMACYVADQLLMSAGMARATYLMKVAVDPRDVTPTLTMGVTIDHVFSITTAVASGFLWSAAGPRAVFAAGALLALANLVAALRVRTPPAGPRGEIPVDSRGD